MKIREVAIVDFHQFSNLVVNLTYPAGHAKAGQPLDKVCIIGQSGTGKTTLLNIISGLTFTHVAMHRQYDRQEFIGNIYVTFEVGNLQVRGSANYDKENDKNQWLWNERKLDGEAVDIDRANEYYQEFYKGRKSKLIYLPADLKYDDTNAPKKDLSENTIIDFRTDAVSSIWKTVFAEVQRYQEEELKLKQEIATVAVAETNIKKIQAAVSKLEKWKAKSPNPIKKVADECLDPVLKHLKLRVSTKDFTFDSKEDLGILKIEDFNSREVPYTLLSTGTKQIMLTALPLFFLKPNHTVILCDEPERSLYPTMQKFIVDYYMSLASNSQFFFATHSPIIASCFDPWEIVELKFNDEGRIYQEQYYPDGAERHIDNYTIVPSYLTYDQMLSKVFDMPETHSYERSEKIAEVLMLRNRLQKFQERGEINSENAKSVHAKYKDLAAKLFWDFEIG
jgi:predicted ATP-dependent endonuclease of OLD family